MKGGAHNDNRSRHGAGDTPPPRVAPRLEGKVKNVGIKPIRKPKQK
jgi:hypothetical protein